MIVGEFLPPESPADARGSLVVFLNFLPLLLLLLLPKVLCAEGKGERNQTQFLVFLIHTPGSWP